MGLGAAMVLPGMTMKMTEARTVGKPKARVLKNGEGKQSELEIIENYLTEKYVFRYNIISNDEEYRQKSGVGMKLDCFS